MTSPKDQRLACSIENRQVVIRIGLNTLTMAAEHCERFYDHEQHGGPPYVKVVDVDEFAGDVVRMLTAEVEDGSSPLTELLDTAFEAAMDDGSIGIEPVLNYPKGKHRRN